LAANAEAGNANDAASNDIVVRERPSAFMSIGAIDFLLLSFRSEVSIRIGRPEN